MDEGDMQRHQRRAKQLVDAQRDRDRPAPTPAPEPDTEDGSQEDQSSS